MDVFDLAAKITLNIDNYLLGLEKARTSSTNLSATLQKGLSVAAKAAAGALTAVTTAAGKFTYDSIKVGANFDKSMSQVAATMGLTMDEMANETGTVDLAWDTFSGNLRDYALEMGKNTAFSATQAADALNYMALAGYKTQESMEMLPNVLNLAAAGSFDLARASDMITDTQTAFGISFERTSQLVDEMAKAASTGNTSVEQLGDAFLVVGGLAQELNGGFVSLEDGTQAPVDGLQEMEIALTAMANAGIKGSEAGTHMRNMITKLSSPTDKGVTLLKELGVSVFNAEGRMRSLNDIMSDLSVALGGLSQAKKIQAITELFNARDLASAEALLNAVDQDWDKIGSSILDAEGAAQQMADTQLDNLAGDVTLFKSALEGAQVTLSDELTPSLRKFVSFGTGAVSDLTDAFEEGGIEGLINSLAPLLADGVGVLAGYIPDVISLGSQFIGVFAESIAEKIPDLIDTGLTMLTSIGDGMVEGIPDFFANVLPRIMEFTGQLRERTGEFVDVGLEFIINMVQGLADGLPELITYVPTIISNIAGIINDNMPKILAAGIQIIMILAAGVIDAVPTLIQEFPKIVLAIWDVITAVNWISLGANLITWIANGVKNLGTAVPNLLRDIGTRAANFIRNINWAGAGQSIINFLSTGIRGMITQIPNLLLQIGRNALNLVRTLNWADLGRSIINFVVKGLQSLISNIPNVLKGIGNTALNAFKNINWWGVGWGVIQGIINGITAGASSIITAAQNAAKSALSAAKRFLGIASPSKVFRDQVGKMMALGMGEGFEDNIPIDAMRSGVEDAIDGMSNLGSPAFGLGDDAFPKRNGFFATFNIYTDPTQDKESIAREVQDKFLTWYEQEAAIA